MIFNEGEPADKRQRKSEVINVIVTGESLMLEFLAAVGAVTVGGLVGWLVWHVCEAIVELIARLLIWFGLR